ncbi:MAG TPA: hypothetical protein VIN59_09490 [Alphaproteobacteria bacterium]
MRQHDFLDELQKRHGNAVQEMVNENLLPLEEALHHLVNATEDESLNPEAVISYATDLFYGDMPKLLPFLARLAPHADLGVLLKDDSYFTEMFDTFDDDSKKEDAENQFVDFAINLHKQGNISAIQLSNFRDMNFYSGATLDRFLKESELAVHLYADALKAYEKPEIITIEKREKFNNRAEMVAYHKALAESPMAKRAELLDQLTMSLSNEVQDIDILDLYKLTHQALTIKDITIDQYISHASRLFRLMPEEQKTEAGALYVSDLKLAQEQDVYRNKAQDYGRTLYNVAHSNEHDDATILLGREALIEYAHRTYQQTQSVYPELQNIEKEIAELPEDRRTHWVQNFIELYDDKAKEWGAGRVLRYGAAMANLMDAEARTSYVERLLKPIFDNGLDDRLDPKQTKLYFEKIAEIIDGLSGSTAHDAYQNALLKELKNERLSLNGWLELNLETRRQVPLHKRFDYYKNLIGEVEALAYVGKASDDQLSAAQFDLGMRARKYARNDEDRNWATQIILSNAASLGIDMTADQRSKLRDAFQTFNGSEKRTNGMQIVLGDKTGKNGQRPVAFVFASESGEPLVDYLDFQGPLSAVNAQVEAKYTAGHPRRKTWDALRASIA